MNLSESKPIFIQIKHWVEDHVLRGDWGAGYQLPSVREMSAKFRVNANTIVRTYEHLAFEGTIYSVRGVGYFVGDGARQSVIERRRKEFFEEQLPSFLRQLDVLDIDKEDIIRQIRQKYEDK